MIIVGLNKADVCSTRVCGTERLLHSTGLHRTEGWLCSTVAVAESGAGRTSLYSGIDVPRLLLKWGHLLHLMPEERMRLPELPSVDKVS